MLLKGGILQLLIERLAASNNLQLLIPVTFSNRLYWLKDTGLFYGLYINRSLNSGSTKFRQLCCCWSQRNTNHPYPWTEHWRLVSVNFWLKHHYLNNLSSSRYWSSELNSRKCYWCACKVLKKRTPCFEKGQYHIPNLGFFSYLKRSLYSSLNSFK